MITTQNSKNLRRSSPASCSFNPSTTSGKHTYPMQAVGTDLSGYLCTEKLRRTDTESVIKQLTHWFQLLDWPETIRSDSGPQYRREFDEFCEENDVKHELSSPYNPQSNGLAEAAEKNAKQLLTKYKDCLLYTSPSPRDGLLSRMPSSA